MFTENTAIFMADLGVSATWYSAQWAMDQTGPTLDSSTFGPGGLVQQTALVLFDGPDIEIVSRRVNSNTYKITYPQATTFVGIKFGDAVTILQGRFAGNYRVIQVNDVDDGVIQEAILEAISPAFPGAL